MHPYWLNDWHNTEYGKNLFTKDLKICLLNKCSITVSELSIFPSHSPKKNPVQGLQPTYFQSRGGFGKKNSFINISYRPHKRKTWHGNIVLLDTLKTAF